MRRQLEGDIVTLAASGGDNGRTKRLPEATATMRAWREPSAERIVPATQSTLRGVREGPGQKADDKAGGRIPWAQLAKAESSFPASVCVCGANTEATRTPVYAVKTTTPESDSGVHVRDNKSSQVKSTPERRPVKLGTFVSSSHIDRWHPADDSAAVPARRRRHRASDWPAITRPVACGAEGSRCATPDSS